MTTSEGEITLPLGIKIKGGAIKGFYSNLGWIACVAALGYSLYGPPQRIAMWMGKVDARLDNIEKALAEKQPHKKHDTEASIPHKRT